MPFVFVFLPVLFAFACYGEVKSRRIPNWLTLAGMALGLGSALIEGWLPGLWDSFLFAVAAFTPGSAINEAIGSDFTVRELLIKLPIF